MLISLSGRVRTRYRPWPLTDAHKVNSRGVQNVLRNVRCAGTVQKNEKADRVLSPSAVVLRGGAFVPGIGMNDVAVLVSPGDFLVAQFNLLQVVVLLKAGP
jgi:hypothetical protein